MRFKCAVHDIDLDYLRRERFISNMKNGNVEIIHALRMYAK